MSARSSRAGILGGLALLGLLLAVSGGGAAAQTDSEAGRPPAYQLLDQVASAVRERSYRGTFIYHYGGRMEAMGIVHRGGPDGRRERLYSLNGAAREIIRDDERVTCILPDDGSVLVDRRQLRNPLSGVLPSVGFEVKPVYRVRLAGRGRIAGRDARQLLITPRDRFRYGVSLWVDQKTSLLLRSDLLDRQGKAVEQIMFTELEVLEAVPDEWLEPDLPAGDYRWYRQPAGGPHWVAESPQEPAWVIERLPEGFIATDFQRAAIAAHDGIVEHQVLSDGFATISVYVNPLGEAPPLQGDFRLGAVHAHGSVVDGHQVVVVGAVPPATVAMVADSVRYRRRP